MDPVSKVSGSRLFKYAQYQLAKMTDYVDLNAIWKVFYALS